MAPRRAQQIPGIQMADLPDGETTFRVTKEHKADYDPPPLSQEDVARYPHRLCRFADGAWAYLSNSGGGPLQPEEISQRHGPGLYRQTPIDPQTRQPIEHLATESKILQPDYATPYQPPQHTAPAPPQMDLHTQMLLQEKLRIERVQEELQAERQRMREEQAQAAREAKEAAERAMLAAEKRESEKWDRLMGIGAALLSAAPALFAAVKPMLVPQQPAAADSGLAAEFKRLREELAQSKPREPDQFEQLQKLIVTKKLTEALEDMTRKDDDEGDIERVGKMVESAAPAVVAVLDRVAPRNAGQPQPAQSPLASPDALVAEVMRVGPDNVGQTLKDLAAKHPQIATMIANTLQAKSEQAEESGPRKLRRVSGDEA